MAANPYDKVDPLTPAPAAGYPKPEYNAQPANVKTDFYVTYTVKPEYAGAYAGAATVGETFPSKYVVKQGDGYAKNDNNTLASVETVDIENVQENMQWYLRPNFDIDKEMGYNYDVQKVDTRDEEGNALTSHIADEAETNADYVTDGKAGFDPYNLQIQSASNTGRYFKTNSTGMKLTNGDY